MSESANQLKDKVCDETKVKRDEEIIKVVNPNANILFMSTISESMAAVTESKIQIDESPATNNQIFQEIVAPPCEFNDDFAGAPQSTEVVVINDKATIQYAEDIILSASLKGRTASESTVMSSTSHEFANGSTSEGRSTESINTEQNDDKEESENNEITNCKILRPQNMLKIVEWVFCIISATILFVAFVALILFYSKGKKIYDPPDNSKEAYMKMYNMTKEDYEMQVSLAKKNPSLWFG